MASSNPVRAWLTRLANTPVSPKWGTRIGVIVIVLGLILVVVLQALGQVPESIFGAATYFGITGVAIMVRSNPATAQSFSRRDFLLRFFAGAVVVAAALLIEGLLNWPDAASWCVYVLAVLAEWLLWKVDIRWPAPGPGAGSSGGGAGAP